jgi:hypothetical protein
MSTPDGPLLDFARGGPLRLANQRWIVHSAYAGTI